MFKTHLYQLFFIVILPAIFFAQERRIITDNEAQMITEIKGVALFENSKVKIGPTAPVSERAKEYQDLDLKEEDEIQFVNGNRIKTISDLKKHYASLEIGTEVKFGVKRGDERFIVTFKKGKMEGPMRILKIGGDSKEGDPKIEDGKIIIGGKKMDLDSLKKAGGKVIIKK